MKKVYEKEVYGITTNGVRIFFGTFKGTKDEMLNWMNDIPKSDWASVNTHIFFPSKYASIVLEAFTPEEIEELKANGEYD